MSEKNSFLLYTDFSDELELLTLEQRGQWITAVFNYARDGELPAFEDIAVRMMFSQTRRCLDRDAEKYAEICAKNSENGKRGGAPLGNQNARKTTGRLKNQPNQADNENESDIENVHDTDNENVRDTRSESGKDIPAPFSPPSLAEIAAFISEHGYIISPERFFNYYASQQWTVGKARLPLTDWKSKIVEWNNSEYTKQNVEPSNKSAPSYSIEEAEERTRRKYANL